MNWYRFLKFAKRYTYHLPDNLKERMYDFYMFSVLPKTEDIYLSDALDQIEEEVIGKLKQHLLDVVFFALMAELRHVFMQNGIENLINKMKKKEAVNIIKGSEGQSLPEYIPLLQQYHDLCRSKVPVESDPSVEKRMRTFKEDSESYRASNRSMRLALKETGFDKVDAIKLAVYLFDTENASWSYSYGGKMWKHIAEAWLKLYYATDVSKIIVYIDHVYDLQHNSDTIFNKNVAYGKVSKEGMGVDFGWIKNALDHKAKIKSPYELLPYVSPQMRKIASALLHEYYGADKPMASTLYFAEHGEKIKDKWKALVAGNVYLFKDMPKIVINLFAEKEMVDFIKTVITSEREHNMVHMWSHFVPSYLKEFFWKEHTSTEIKKIFYPDFASDPTLFASSFYDDLCGEYTPSKFYTPEEQKNIWLIFFRNHRGRTKYMSKMPPEVAELFTEDDAKQLIDYHIRDLWQDEERTKLVPSTLNNWKLFVPEIKNAIDTGYHEELERIGKQAIYQDIMRGSGLVENSMDADLRNRIGIKFFASHALRVLKGMEESYRWWYNIPYITNLWEEMYKLDPDYIEKGVVDYFAGEASWSVPSVVRIFKALIAEKASTFSDPGSSLKGYEEIFPPTPTKHKISPVEYSSPEEYVMPSTQFQPPQIV